MAEMRIVIDGRLLGRKLLKQPDNMDNDYVTETESTLRRTLELRRVSPRLAEQMVATINTCKAWLGGEGDLTDDELLNRLAEQERTLQRSFETDETIAKLKNDLKSNQQDSDAVIRKGEEKIAELEAREAISKSNQQDSDAVIRKGEEKIAELEAREAISVQQIQSHESNKYLLKYGDYFGFECLEYRKADESRSFRGFWTSIWYKIGNERDEIEAHMALPSMNPPPHTPILDAIRIVSQKLDIPEKDMIINMQHYALRNELAHSRLEELERMEDWPALAEMLDRDQRNIKKYLPPKLAHLQDPIFDTINRIRDRIFLKDRGTAVFDPTSQEGWSYKYVRAYKQVQKEEDFKKLALRVVKKAAKQEADKKARFKRKKDRARKEEARKAMLEAKHLFQEDQWTQKYEGSDQAAEESKFA